MSTISPSLQIGGVNGWKGKEGAVLGWQQTSGGLFKPAKFDFSRLSGSASYVDENGLIQIEHRPNYPRFTYQDGKQCLMNEEARTNSLLYSEQLDNSVYTKRGTTTITANDTTAPDGTTTADLVSNLGAITVNDIFQICSGLSVSVTVSPSFYILKGAASGVLELRNSVSSSLGQWNIDLSLVNSNWERIDVNSPAVTVINDFETNGSGQTGIQLGYTSGLGNFHLWGVQLEAGSYPSSYIPTEGSAVTRAAESIEGLNLGNFLGDSEGGLYVDGAFQGANNFISISDGTLADRFFLRLRDGLSAEWGLINSSGTGFTNNFSGLPSTDTFYKVFSAFAVNDAVIYADGTQKNTQNSFDIYPSNKLTDVRLDSGAGSDIFRGLIHELRVYDQRPTNAQLESDTQ